MSILNRIKDSISETSQDVAQKAKDTSEIMRLNSLIKANEKEIEKQMYQIGISYFTNYNEECMERFPELAGRVKELQEENMNNKEIVENLGVVKVCPNCGKKINDDAAFCIYCGGAIQVQQENQTAPTSRKCCSSCGFPVSEEDMYCINCGTSLK